MNRTTFFFALTILLGGCASPASFKALQPVDPNEREVATFQFEADELRFPDLRVIPAVGVTAVNFSRISSDHWLILITDDRGERFEIEAKGDGTRFSVSGLPNHVFGFNMSAEPSLTILAGRGGRWVRSPSDTLVRLWREGERVADWETPEAWKGAIQAVPAR